MSDYPPGYTPHDPPDDLDAAVRDGWTHKEFRGSWAQGVWERPDASLHLCCVCGAVVAPDADGRRRFEGITAAGTKRWIWGPYPCHDECRTEVRTPFDHDPQAVPTWERL